jgi:hypothetical protein
MKFTLHEYQRDAVLDVLDNLDAAKVLYHVDGKESSFSLTASTGAGKTVMAAAVIEALFYGSDEFEFDADPGAVVLWFSDSPALNNQSRTRLRQASEKFTASDLVLIEPPFPKARLEPGKVYFLNTQKLSSNSLLVRGHVEDTDGTQPLFERSAPDLQGWTIWQTIANTIDDDSLTLYLIQDEAHRGVRSTGLGEKPTVVGKLINGHAGYPPIPIVWGISATPERFDEAMKEASVKGRRPLDPVMVSPSRVQDSGLVKDALALEIPNEAGNFDSVLVRRAARKLRESTERWRSYASEEEMAEPVQPLLVLQTPNTPDPDNIGVALDTIADEYPEIRGDAVRHVLGDHSTQRFGGWDVDWIEPERVEDAAYVRVLIAKDAISTGWDCPRAEVMVSFRPARENTHITQLLGRMVRSPLAMRIPGDEYLNTVDCILPFFDRTTAGNVVRYITGNLAEMPGKDKKVLLDARELKVNPSVPDSVWSVWDSLPTETLPQRGARPVKRLVALAQALSQDKLRTGALKEVEEHLHRILDGYTTVYLKQVTSAEDSVWTVQLQRIAGRVGVPKLAYEDFAAKADDRAILSGFETARRAFGADVATSYVNHLAGDDGTDDDGLRDAYVRAAALATVKDVRVKVDEEALHLTNEWFARHRVAIKALPDLRRAGYEAILAMSTEPQRASLGRPRTRLEDFAMLDENDQMAAAPLAPLHLMADDDGQFPLGSLNDWEQDVVNAEIRRPGTVGWYRNPARAATDSLGIAYRDDEGNWHSMHPDFVFFQDVHGETRALIVDPHGHHLPDAKLKLRALASFAERYGDEFHRIDAVDKIGNDLRVLNMKRADVRAVVLSGRDSAEQLYKMDDLASDFDADD